MKFNWSTCIVVTTPFRFTSNTNYDECTITLDNHQIKVILYISITFMIISLRKYLLITFDRIPLYISIKYIWLLYEFLRSNLFCHFHGIIHMVEFRYDINYYCSDMLGFWHYDSWSMCVHNYRPWVLNRKCISLYNCI